MDSAGLPDRVVHIIPSHKQSLTQHVDGSKELKLENEVVGFLMKMFLFVVSQECDKIADVIIFGRKIHVIKTYYQL